MNNHILKEENTKSSYKLRVGILSALSGDGASFTAEKVLFEGLFTGRTPEGLRTLVEIGKPHFYYSLAMDKRFYGRNFFDFTKDTKYECNYEFGCNWYLKKEDKILEPSKLYKVINFAPGNLVIFDLSSMQKDGELFNILSEMDLIYFVVDALPSKLIPNKEFIDKVLALSNVEIVINKYNKGIKKNQLVSFLGTGNFHIIYEQSFEDIYRAEYNGRPIYM